MKEIFEYSDYKAYLRAKVGERSTRRGLKLALSQAVGCHTTYVSQVLNGNAHFSAEQAVRINAFFGHTRDESHFFLLLLSKDRAGSPTLREYYQEQIQQHLNQRLSLVRRAGGRTHLSQEDQTTFYSSWHYTSIHVALTVPALQTKDAIVRYFGLPMKKVVSVLEFLLRTGLAVQEGDRFIPGHIHSRIGNDSPQILRHHSNWRTQALESLDREDLLDLHYSGVMSLSAADVRALKELMLESLKVYAARVRDSKEETVYALCLDFFGLKRTS